VSRAVEAVVFDLDGVLIDSEAAWDAARRALVAERGGTWREEATRAMMGMSAPEWSRYLVEELGVPVAPAEVDGAVVDALLRGYAGRLPLLPGAVEAVERMAAAAPLGLASSSNRRVIDLVLAEMGVAGRFAATVSSEEVARGKPAPDVYTEAVRRLGAQARGCVAIEDSENGIRSAAAAGLRVIAVPNAAFPPAADALALAALVLDGVAQVTPEALASM
jgi:HAD superfamily hydrolase (TIGR01509 family)